MGRFLGLKGLNETQTGPISHFNPSDLRSLHRGSGLPAVRCVEVHRDAPNRGGRSRAAERARLKGPVALVGPKVRGVDARFVRLAQAVFVVLGVGGVDQFDCVLQEDLGRVPDLSCGDAGGFGCIERVTASGTGG